MLTSDFSYSNYTDTFSVNNKQLNTSCGWQALRLTEESNMHKSLNNKTKQDFDKSVEGFKKTLGKDLSIILPLT